MASPGIRYERLLFWAAPITLVACAVFIATFAYNNQEEIFAANCYDSASAVIELNKPELEAKWLGIFEDKKLVKKNIGMASDYNLRISHLFIYGSPFKCWKFIDGSGVARDQKPNDISSQYKALSSELRKKPVVLYGISIPDKATIGLGGTKLDIPMAVFVQALQLALAPVMLLWLGSLYHTRLRESIKINRTDDIVELHPHVINIYPIGYYPDLRKKSWWKARAPFFWGIFFFSVRVLLLGIFVLPSILLYLASLFYQPVFGYWVINFFSGFFVFLYGLGIFFMETVSAGKVFKGSSPLR